MEDTPKTKKKHTDQPISFSEGSAPIRLLDAWIQYEQNVRQLIKFIMDKPFLSLSFSLFLH